VGEIKMPQLGESVVEGTITKWLKKEGEEVGEDDLLVEVSTDKVDSEVPSSESGTLQKILVEEGETVKVGTPIAVVGEGAASSDGQGDSGEDESGDAEAKSAGDEAQAQAEDEDQQERDAAEIDRSEKEGDAAAAEAEGGDGETKEQPQEEQKREQEEEDQDRPAAEAEEQPSEERAEGKEDTSKRGIISPLVRRLADENDVDLDDVHGTGTGGRIRKADVMKYVETRKSKPAAKPAASAEPAPEEAKPASKEAARAEPSVREVTEREELVPWTNIRRRTAEHMVASSRETARAWNAVEADWTNIVKLREAAKETFKEREGFNLTYMPFLARVLCETLLDMPEVNATYDEENQGNRVKHYVNMGIAVALEGGGLIVPVVKGADEKNLVGMARDISDVASRARSKKLSPDDLAGGTFTITNPGPFGSVISVPIIPRGQTAIIGFEAIKKRVIVTDDESIAIRSMGFLSLSWDHRIIDGAEAARFLSNLVERVETTDFTSELAHYI
jgi:2-oxoglutarate dehydrogenase E2 component (dihydrolipoamide succinyltransferase)